MNETKVTFSLELEFAEGALRGKVVPPDGSAREFTGWIGLLGVIDQLLAACAPASDAATIET